MFTYIRRRPLLLLALFWILLSPILYHLRIIPYTPKNDISTYAPIEEAHVNVKILYGGEKRQYGFRVPAQAIKMNDQPTHGKILLTLPPHVEPPLPGDILNVIGNLRRPSIATNPGAFDYRMYLARQGIHSTLWSWQVLKQQLPSGWSRFSLFRASEYLKRKILTNYSRSLSPEVSRVVSGIVLGVKPRDDKTLMNSFIRTGTMHILVVSGLHVGFVGA